MGGQACVFYGAAEFSKDIDIAIAVDAMSLQALTEVLKALLAVEIALPPFSADNLLRGHAVRFRCKAPEADNIRLVVMANMRGVDSFADLWKRRTTINEGGPDECNLMGLPDLVQAKKTQRDKDWPMIRRLLEANYFQNRDRAEASHVSFWLRELRSPELLCQVARLHGSEAASLTQARPLLKVALSGDVGEVADALDREERAERDLDRAYWLPLKLELEEMRRNRLRSRE